MRAADFGANTRYYEEANDQVVLMLQAEDIQARQNLDTVLAADGYEALFIGPMDLSRPWATRDTRSIRTSRPP